MSRPKLSVPSQKVCATVLPSTRVKSPLSPAGLLMKLESMADGSNVPSQGASKDTKTMNPSTKAPNRIEPLAHKR